MEAAGDYYLMIRLSLGVGNRCWFRVELVRRQWSLLRAQQLKAEHAWLRSDNVKYETLLVL